MKHALAAGAAAVLTTFGGPAQAAQPDTSLQLSGMPGYTAEPRKNVDFGTYGQGNIFYCQPEKICTSATPGFSNEGKLIAEGKLKTVHYSANKSAGTLAVYRNYDNAIKSLGGQKLTYSSGHEGVHVFLVDDKQKKTWVVLTDDYDSSYTITTIEEKAMVQQVTASQMAQEIGKQGYATLYVNFDNNKAELKPDATPTVEEIAKLLKTDATLRLSVDGHTDNVGSADANKKLSLARAGSVMQAIVARGIDAKRLQAKGYGSEVPIADNRNDEGRAKNRRVELTKIK